MKLHPPCIIIFLPLIFNLSVSHAQVPVHEEPRHRPVFQNSKIRILNVLLPPGDTTLYHIHHTPSLFIFLTSTAIGSQLQNGSPTQGKSVSGIFLFENLAPPNIRIHRVWNSDKDTLHVMDIELLSKDSAFTLEPINLPELSLVTDTNWIRAYRFKISAGHNFSLGDNNRAMILISLNASQVQINQSGKLLTQTIEPGTFFQIRKGRAFSLKNNINAPIQFALLELP